MLLKSVGVLPLVAVFVALKAVVASTAENDASALLLGLGDCARGLADG
jgi:hypothetical protein